MYVGFSCCCNLCLINWLGLTCTAEVLSRAELEQEYLFIDAVSTYIRAIRAGAIHPRHGAVLLAHYGRLGSAFDACTKVIVDVLREEGMMYGNGDIVVTVVTQAMQEVSKLRPVLGAHFDERISAPSVGV